MSKQATESSSELQQLFFQGGFFEQALLSKLSEISSGTLMVQTPSRLMPLGKKMASRPKLFVKNNDFSSLPRRLTRCCRQLRGRRLDDQRLGFVIPPFFAKSRSHGWNGRRMGDPVEQNRPLGLCLEPKKYNQGSRKNIALHYDLGNDFYELMLDPR